MYLFDTNIFLEILLCQEKAAACRNALNQVNEENLGWVTGYSIHSIEAILSRNCRSAEILPSFLENLARNELIQRYETTLEEEGEISKLMRKLHLDFDDTLQYFIAQKEQLVLVTLDHDFQKVSGIRIISPDLV